MRPCLRKELNKTFGNFWFYRNQPEVMELLLQTKAKINTLNRGRCSALHVAVNKQHIECVKVLLKHKCNINIQVDAYLIIIITKKHSLLKFHCKKLKVINEVRCCTWLYMLLKSINERFFAKRLCFSWLRILMETQPCMTLLERTVMTSLTYSSMYQELTFL